jgi:hypothetical protein
MMTFEQEQLTKQAIQGDLNRRNTETISAKLEEMNQRIYEQDKKIAASHQAISAFSERMISLENQLLMFKVKAMGTGPSA